MHNKQLELNIAILITVFNRKEKTRECLTALMLQKITQNIQLCIFVTNDGCTDGTAEMIVEEFPSVRLVDGNGDLFWNRGMRNAWETAVKFGSFDYFLWLNDDTVLLNTAIKDLLKSSIELKDQCIIVGTTVSINNSVDVTYGGRTRSGKLIMPAATRRECAYFNGNIVLIPNYVFTKVGFNDEVFHHALGDYDYGLRASKLGVKSYVAPGILGKCEEHEGAAIWCNPLFPLSKRLAHFKTPLGQNPSEFFIYDKRHNGILIALFHYFTIHIRLFFPSFFRKYGDKC